MKSINITFSLIIIILSSCSSGIGQDGIQLQSFATGFSSPVAIAHADDERMFVVERAGRIKICDLEGNVNGTPFLDITDRVKSGGEQGLLGLAFHPDYNSNGYFYVNYTDDDNSTNIARFSVTANPNEADPDSEKTLMIVEQPFQNHNGGHLSFGPDGYLYIGLGDGGSGGDPGNRSQNLEVLLGKMLRIDVDNGDPYGIPEDNPFIDEPDALNEIWASGLRNPWKYTFDSETGDLWIADVGQNAVEEIDLQPASSAGGENYGWRCYEGTTPYNTNGCGSQSQYVFPVYEYAHDFGCSVTGGYVYRGENIPQLKGFYVYTDYCTDQIWTLHQAGDEWINQSLGTFAGNNFSTFGTDKNGELYIAGLSSGTIYKFINTASGFNDHSETGLLFYPNPFINRVAIQHQDDHLIKSISISNLQGKQLYHQIANPNSAIELDFLPAGIYIALVETSANFYYSKLTKLK